MALPFNLCEGLEHGSPVHVADVEVAKRGVDWNNEDALALLRNNEVWTKPMSIFSPCNVCLVLAGEIHHPGPNGTWARQSGTSKMPGLTDLY